MTQSVKELIKRRKSVRTFDGVKLHEEDLKDLEEYIGSLTNPFNVPITFRILDTKEHGLSSAVIVGEHTYLAAKAERVPLFEMAFGYSFEKVCLYALSKGIGTVMLAATLSRPDFEKAMEVGENEIMPLASPIGYPADKRSLRDGMMRKTLGSDTRNPFEKIFFNESFDKPLTADEAGIYAEPLEMARWAPSAANKQPLRAVLDGDRIHFYKAHTMKENPLGDIQKVDLGIALSHFDLVLKENGTRGTFTVADPGISHPDNVTYMVTYERE